MKQWDYMVAYVNSDDDDAQIQDKLVQLGRHGWELVQIQLHGRVFLKREIDEKNKK
jgi:hypothetical protein